MGRVREHSPRWRTLPRPMPWAQTTSENARDPPHRTISYGRPNHPRVNKTLPITIHFHKIVTCSVPEEHLIPDLGLWILPIPDATLTVPERARGSWRVEAPPLSGREDAAGLRVGDILSEVDGKKPATFDELRRRLAAATNLKVLRFAVSETELH